MKRALISLIVVLSLLETGCKPKATTPVAAPAAADTFTNKDGVVTGNVSAIGLKLEVRGLKDHGVGSKHSFSFKSTPSGDLKTDRWEISAGEVRIVLDKNGDGPAGLKVDDQDFGMIQQGEELLIDEKRQVFIDGAKREPT